MSRVECPCSNRHPQTMPEDNPPCPVHEPVRYKAFWDKEIDLHLHPATGAATADDSPEVGGKE